MHLNLPTQLVHKLFARHHACRENSLMWELQYLYPLFFNEPSYQAVP